MKIAVLGAGNVGSALSKGFKKYGYDVTVGTRNPKNHEGTVEYEQAAQGADIIVLCVKGREASETLKKIRNIDGKIVIDVTNPIDESKKPENGVLHFYTSLDSSQMERLQKEFPKARFVKAFNSIGSAHMVDPQFSPKPSMFICGNDEDAKKTVSEIVEKFGFDVEDMGKAEAARAIEPLCILWCIPGMLRNDWSYALKLLHKN